MNCVLTVLLIRCLDDALQISANLRKALGGNAKDAVNATGKPVVLQHTPATGSHASVARCVVSYNLSCFAWAVVQFVMHNAGTTDNRHCGTWCEIS